MDDNNFQAPERRKADPRSGDITSKSTPSRRRNGQQAACEPCRKGKVRCDHASPICSRCRKRKIPAQCIFLAAPMTQTKDQEVSFSQPLSPPSTQLSNPASQIEVCSIDPVEPEPLREYSGFLGLTSFSATIPQGDLTADPESITQNPLIATPYNIASSSAHFQLGVKILNQLPSEEASQYLLDRYLSKRNEVSFHKPSLQLSLKAFWKTFGYKLGIPNTKPSNLEAVASAIFQNESSPLQGSDNPEEWMSLFSGFNTRWETLGILFVVFAYTLLSMPEEDISVVFGAKAKERSVLIAEMKGCVEACIELCRSFLNVLVCNLLYKNMLLETVLRGDASLSAWRLNNDLVGTAVAYGLHCCRFNSKITVQSETIKKLSCCIFWSDKELSIFTGRPPSLSNRYFTCPLPLDLGTEDLMAGGERLERAINSLDENGWNTQGEIYSATICRMMVMCAMIQDEIMEMFLGTHSEWSLERLEELKIRTREMHSGFPVQLQASKTEMRNCTDDRILWRLLCGRLDYLRIHLLLERLSTERGGASKRDLFEVAREMLDLNVFLWVERDRSSDRVHNYDYMIMSYGMPSIGILCTELLKQVKRPEEVEIKLPVSEIVQNLSLMVAFLDWIKPTAGNYKLCRPLARVIRRVLDQVFEPAAAEVPREKESLRQVEMADDTWSLDNMDDLEWLNSIDWTSSQYIDFN